MSREPPAAATQATGERAPAGGLSSSETQNDLMGVPPFSIVEPTVDFAFGEIRRDIVEASDAARPPIGGAAHARRSTRRERHEGAGCTESVSRAQLASGIANPATSLTRSAWRPVPVFA